MNKVEINDLLYKVEKPARYLGNEINTVHKPSDGKTIRFGFCFPDIYEIGMSHLGLQIIYYLLNNVSYVSCERVFAPAQDMEQKMREHEIPLFGLESREPVKHFDFVGFTLQYELSFTNILNMLDLAQIPIYSAERQNKDPIVVLGGPCAYNPEPVADFADIVVLGEGEEVLLEIMELYKKNKENSWNRKIFLEKAAQIPGVYVPGLYKVNYNEDGTVASYIPEKDNIPPVINKRIVKDLERSFYPEAMIVPYLNVVHDRAVLELFRGCSRGCRFCQAGMIYRPVREKSPSRLLQLADTILQSTGYEEISFASLSSSDYSYLQELVENLMNRHNNDRIGISLPSLRLDNFTLELIKEIQKIRKTGLTFAPEAGTQRLRNVINKGITEEDLLNAVKKAFASGWNNVKLYFMIGLPTESEEDLMGIKDLAFKVADAYYQIPAEDRNKGLNITVSTSTFVPKAFTPFQWETQISIEEIKKKQQYLKDIIKRKNIVYNYHSAESSYLESIFARGDRKLSKVLYIAFKKGCKFDGWIEFFKFDKWMEAFRKAEINPDFYTSRLRKYDEILPWEHINPGIHKEYLIAENEKSKKGELTKDCRINCTSCGINKVIAGGIC